MCGICGFSGSAQTNILSRMTDELFHRGPDHRGLWENQHISLGMRRLSIVDLETGNQPIFNEDGTIVAIFNGEIYNHIELRHELELAGHIFSTHHSDSETIVHLYEDYGLDFLNKINGMFAIALWDGKLNRLVLARDRAGVKPLYFGEWNGRLIFGSEIKSILVNPNVSKKPNYLALNHYFSFKNIPAPMTSFSGIEQLLPGELLVWEKGRAHREKWWTLEFREDSTIDEHEAATTIRELLESSVNLRMRTDVPFGAYLSGGLDSSSIVALMSQNSGGAKIKTFSLVYCDDLLHKNIDQECARLVAKEYATDHYEFELSAYEVSNSLDDVVRSFDEPFSGVTSTFFVTQLIKKHVKVALSGDGADELFGSYQAHRLAQPLHFFLEVKNRLNTMSHEEIEKLRPYHDQIDLLKSLYERGDEVERRYCLTLWGDKDKHELFSEKMLSLSGMESSEKIIRNTYNKFQTVDPLNRALAFDFSKLLPDQVLAFVDRLSMAHSVEVRTPFLDYRLMEFSARLPGAMKIKAGRSKHILKEAVKGLIPSIIIERPKEGFVLPIDMWLRTRLNSMLKDCLSNERLQSHGLLNAPIVQKLIAEHTLGVANHGPRLWNLIMFQKWWDQYFVN